MEIHTDEEWEKWGERDPYFGVVTHPRFRRATLTEHDKAAFFQSGDEHVGHVIRRCRQYFGECFAPKKALEFGCGVGRLVLPMARICERVVGMDVSISMLKEAKQNCEKQALQNVELVQTKGWLPAIPGSFDFIHSYIVFQHIAAPRGTEIFAHLLGHLDHGGVGAVQLTYAKKRYRRNYGSPSLSSPKYWAGRLLKELKRVTESRKTSDPEMQMNPYKLSQLFFALQAAGVENVHVDFTDQFGELGVYLYFQRSAPRW